MENYNIEISFKDGQNWRNIDGEIKFWGEYDVFVKKNSRAFPYFLAPEITSIEWNGFEYDAQLVKWDGYIIDFLIQESELHNVNNLLNVSDIRIKNTVNGDVHYPDTRKSDFLDLEIEKIDRANVFSVNLIYRTKQTIINKNKGHANSKYKLLLYNQNLIETDANYLLKRNIDGEFNTLIENNENVFFTDFEILEQSGNSEQEYVTRLSGERLLTFGKTNTQNLMLILLNDLQNYYLNKYINHCNIVLFVENEVFIDSGYTVVSSGGINLTASSVIADLLYPGMKIKINSEIRTVMSITNSTTFVINEYIAVTNVPFFYEKYTKAESLENISTEKIGKNYNKTEININTETTQTYGS